MSTLLGLALALVAAACYALRSRWPGLIYGQFVAATLAGFCLVQAWMKRISNR